MCTSRADAHNFTTGQELSCAPVQEHMTSERGIRSVRIRSAVKFVGGNEENDLMDMKPRLLQLARAVKWPLGRRG